MNEYDSIDKIFLSINDFIIDYVKLIIGINENSSESNRNMLIIILNKQDFLLSATFTEFSLRAHELQNYLKIYIRNLAQQRRNHISDGIEFVDSQIEIHQFDDDFKDRLEQLQTDRADKTIRCIRMIINDFELFDNIQTSKHSLNITFRLLPILKHIQKQLCCISLNIQKILDDNTHVIEKHLRRIQRKINSYEIDMKTKLEKFIARDIRPPVLVIPCPNSTQSSENVEYPRSSNSLFSSSPCELCQQVIDTCDSELGLYVRRIIFVQILNEHPDIMSILFGEKYSWAYNPNNIRSRLISPFIACFMVARFRLYRIRKEQLKEKQKIFF
ncbi:unnamed protein product [Rotaria magnacalcarata]|uniref:Uncharacterized protein n=2 Tax=Rotaria magnacalcarata TaxID=392030 RepID=A0A816N3Q1_9BILA|nr:unnamed protein product [Rotaria magnacalcarata]CAF2020450.1 unnamed protein product [Rotaria magnacalcarata]